MKLNELSSECVKKHLNECLRFRKDKATVYKRYSAYDYCFNYFRDFYANNRTKDIASADNMNTSCLQLGLFLATWGMYRSSALHNRNFKVYEDLINRISEENCLWKIDVPDYCEKNGTISEETLTAIQNFMKDTMKILSDENYGIKPYEKAYFEEHENLKHKPLNVTITLATKIMMGVFGCVPAYDSYFTEALNNKTLNKKSLLEIYEFYNQHKEILDEKQKEFKTLNVKGGSTEYTYKKAKIIDLIGFRVIQEKSSKKKQSVNASLSLTSQSGTEKAALRAGQAPLKTL